MEKIHMSKKCRKNNMERKSREFFSEANDCVNSENEYENKVKYDQVF